MKIKITRHGKRDYYLLLVFVLLGIITAGWHCKGAALYEEIKALHLEQAGLIEKQESLLAVIEQGEQIKAEWELLDVKNERLDKLIPDLSELPLVLEKLENFLEKYPATVHSLLIGESSFKDDHVTVDLLLSISAAPSTMQSMLLDLEHFPHLVLFEKITWKNRAEDDTAVDLQFMIVFKHEIFADNNTSGSETALHDLKKGVVK